MNGLDIALIVILFFFFLRGIFRGFIKEIMGIVGLVVGFYLAMKYYPALGDTLKPFLQNAAYRNAVGFQVIFIVAFFLVGLIGVLIDKLVKLTISKVANGLIGAVVATVKAVVFCSIILMATTAFIRQDSPFFKDSQMWPYFKNLSEYFREMVPEDLKKTLKAGAEALPEDLKPKLPELPKDGSQDPPPWKPADPDEGTPMPGMPDEGKPPQPAWPGNDGDNT